MARTRANISPEDRAEIYAVAAEHTWCIDRGDGEGLAALFTEDGTIVTQGYSRNGRADILKGYREGGSSQPGFQGRQHHITPYLVWDHPDGGYELLSYWYVTQNTVSEGPILRLHGYSLDHFVQQDGRWLMKSKEVIPWTTESAPMVEDFEAIRSGAGAK